jgi:vacuolar-type H+-ATPase subunit F/Vma7
MRVLVLGTIDDARGFGLAGALVRAPRDGRDLEAALARAPDERPTVGLVLVSAEVAALSPRAIRAFVDRPGAVPLLVLPTMTGDTQRPLVETAPPADGGAREGAR